MPAPTRFGAGSPEDQQRERGAQMVHLLSAVIRIGRAYSVTNQVFRTQLANIADALRPVLEESGEAVFVALHSDLYLNGVRIPVTASSFRFQQTVIEAFKSRGISGIRVERAVSVEDLAKFFKMFLQPTCPHGAALLKACADADLQRILPAIHASTEPGSDAAGADWSAPPAAEEGGAGELRWSSALGSGPRVTAQKQYGRAFEAARSLLTTTALNATLEMRHAKRVVQPLIDGASSSEPIVVGLSSLHEHDEYTYAHAVNVCAVAVTMGHFLKLDRRALADLGVAALLHDVGKDAVMDQILHPLEAFTDEERRAAERHTIEGAKLIARSTALNPTTLRCLRVALEHHVDLDGPTGYPAVSRGYRTSLLSQIVSLADCYVNLHNRRGDLVEHITPYEALGMILGPLCERFEPALLWALVQTVGFYPPGQYLILDDGSVAVVLAPNADDLARPHVKVVAGPGGYALPKEFELLPLPEDRSVLRPLRGEEMPFQPRTRSAA